MKPFGNFALEGSRRFVRTDQLRQAILQFAAVVNGIQQGLGPGPGFDIEIGRTGRIAEFRFFLTGQPVIDVVVGQQNSSQTIIVPGFMLFQPQYFRGGEAGGNRISDQFDHIFGPADAGRDFIALG